MRHMPCADCRRQERRDQLRHPELPAIARQQKATGEYLAGRIIIPHPAMPDIALDIAEIRDVIAYILSLKAK